MCTTTVRAIFYIIGDEFDVNTITKELELIPSAVFTKGEERPGTRHNARYTFTSWSIETGRQESYDVMEQFSQIVSKLNGKEELLVDLASLYDLEYRFCIVISIVNGKTPALVIDKDMIQIAYRIGAIFDIDLYVGD